MSQEKSKLTINEQALQQMPEVPYQMKQFDQHVQELQRIVNTHKKKEKSKELQIQQERVKKNTRKGKIKAALYLAAGVAMATAAYQGAETIQGRDKIVREFSAATSNFGVVNYSTGYQMNEGTTYVDLTTGVNHMVEAARKKGMSDKEIAIGLTACMNKKTAEKALGEENYPTYRERCELYKHVYYSEKATKLQSNIEKGNGK